MNEEQVKSALKRARRSLDGAEKLSPDEWVELIGQGYVPPASQKPLADEAISEFSRREFAGRRTERKAGTQGGDTGGHMLVLSRQRDETVMIGDDIEVTIVDIRGDKVRLGINAPRDIAVHRKEVWDAIRREGKAKADACCGHCGKAFAVDETRMTVAGVPLHAECVRKISAGAAGAGTK